MSGGDPVFDPVALDAARDLGSASHGQWLPLVDVTGAAVMWYLLCGPAAAIARCGGGGWSWKHRVLDGATLRSAVDSMTFRGRRLR